MHSFRFLKGYYTFSSNTPGSARSSMQLHFNNSIHFSEHKDWNMMTVLGKVRNKQGYFLLVFKYTFFFIATSICM